MRTIIRDVRMEKCECGALRAGETAYRQLGLHHGIKHLPAIASTQQQEEEDSKRTLES